MSGLSLEELDASDMIDVVHFLFEEDSKHSSEESVMSQSSVRVALYRDLYGTHYKYAAKKASTAATGGVDYNAEYLESQKSYGPSAEDAGPVNPAEQREDLPMKPPAPPPTEFDPYASNPFEGILDAPMN